MKGRLSLICCAVLALLLGGQTGSAQTIKSQHATSGGEGMASRSAPYVARTPYTLRWTAENRYKLFSKEYVRIKAKDAWTSVVVIDATTAEVVCVSPRFGLSGEFKVPVGGKHIISMSALGKWTADFIEDAAMLKAASDRGELKPDVPIDEARRTSFRTKNEVLEARKGRLLQLIQESRASIGDEAVRQLTENATKAAQIASSEEDFDRRFKAMSEETFERLPLAQSEPEPKKPVPSSTWNGKGLPPGLQIRK